MIGARVGENTWFYLVVTFGLTYGVNNLHISKGALLHTITIGAAISIFTVPLFGSLSDKVGQKRLFLIGLLLMVAFAWPFFVMLETLDMLYVWVAMLFGIGIVFPMTYAPESQLFAAQFPPEVRYSGISLAVQIGGVLGGGLAPMILPRYSDLAGDAPCTLLHTSLCSGFSGFSAPRAYVARSNFEIKGET
jgi:MFS transporter, MHS family, shikimate and dehydroshikimate transport protein